MPLTKPNQQLHRDLKEATALLKWSGVDLKQAAVKLSDAGQEDDARELIAIAMRFQEVEELMDGYADEVKAGRLCDLPSQNGIAHLSENLCVIMACGYGKKTSA
ncbi:hypothetical protein [Pseudomonas synxantha]|uniref:hypothetical protein n=1 Tax=Pseudomonas synxantha TaxID=47883 RepID=UPI00345D1BC9